MLYQMLKKNPHDRPKISEVVEKLTDIVETFEFYEKKKGQGSMGSIGQRDIESSPEKQMTYDPETVKKQYESETETVLKIARCELHPEEIKLYRRSKDIATCQKVTRNIT